MSGPVIRKKWVAWEELESIIGGATFSPSTFVNAGQVGGLTPGSIPFADADGFLTEDNPNLFWDAANARLGLNQLTPTARIDIVAEADRPGINIEAGAVGEMTTPDGQQFRWGHWNAGTTTFTERLKFDAAGVFYVSYLTAGSVIFAGLNGEIKQDNADFNWNTANKWLGIGKAPSNVLDLEGVGSTLGGTSYGGVVARFHCTENKHVTLAIDAITGKDPVLSFSENAVCIWDIRNDASATDKFQIRYQVGEVNRTDFQIDNAGNVSILTGDLIIANGSSINLQEDITFTGATAQNLIKFPDNLPTALDFREGANSYLLFRTSDGTEGVTVGKALTLSAIAAAVADHDKFLVSDAGLVKYRTGAEVLSDIGAEPADATIVKDADFGSAGIMLTDGAGTYSILPGGEILGADHNLFMGTNAGVNLAAGGKYNIFLGEGTGNAVTTQDSNTFIGYLAGNLATAANNVAIGAFAGWKMTGAGANSNALVGFAAGYSLQGGGANMYLGTAAGFTNISGHNTVAIGTSAGYKHTGSFNVFIGTRAGMNLAAGIANVFIGYEAGKLLTTGGSNVYIGHNAGASCGTGGIDNTVIGFYAGYNVEGHYNILLGRDAGYFGTSQFDNVAMGYRALYSNVTGDDNTCIGYTAGYGVGANSHSSNTFIGHSAGKGVTTGGTNVALGKESGFNITSGAGNVCLGYQAGKGQLTVDSNELWIANSNTANPLIYGEFPNTLLRVNAPLDVGRDGALRGALTLWDGAGGNTPGYTKICSPNGTAWYLFVEDDGTVKIHNATPAANADGDAIGDQTD